VTRLKVECLKCGGGTLIKLWGCHILRCKCGWKIMGSGNRMVFQGFG